VGVGGAVEGEEAVETAREGFDCEFSAGEQPRDFIQES